MRVPGHERLPEPDPIERQQVGDQHRHGRQPEKDPKHLIFVIPCFCNGNKHKGEERRQHDEDRAEELTPERKCLAAQNIGDSQRRR